MNFISLAIALALLLAASPAAASCQLQIEADFPVTYIDGHHPVITVQMNGQDMRMMVDSGSQISYLSARAYDTLNLHSTAGAQGRRAIGLGGYVNIIAMTMLDMTFGDVRMRNKVFPISDQMMLSKAGVPMVDGVMGYDVLENFDVGLDLPDNRITFYAPEHCTPQQTPWAGDFAPVPFTRPDDGTPVISETIDNQASLVSIDTGAEISLIMQNALTRNNVTPEASAVQTMSGQGFGNLKFGLHEEKFSSVAVGAEGYPDDWMLVDVTPQVDLAANTDGLLGEDYLSTHRVFIANSSNTAYLGVPAAN